MNDKITIYTDGSSKGNPGPGGFGAIIVSGETVRELGGREPETTNNRMEMQAVISALQSLERNPESQIEIHTDSEYVLKGATVWSKGWQKNGWRTKDKKQVLNQDLWQKILEVLEGRHITWTKVEGHSGHRWNDRCDEIATSFADEVHPHLYNGPKESYK